jgi:hypothetical protein
MPVVSCAWAGAAKQSIVSMTTTVRVMIVRTRVGEAVMAAHAMKVRRLTRDPSCLERHSERAAAEFCRGTKDMRRVQNWDSVEKCFVLEAERDTTDWMIRTAIGAAVVSAMPFTASADPSAAVEATTLVASRVPEGPLTAAPGVGASVEGGWDGARARAIGAITAEALIARRITLRAGAQYELGSTRPSVSGSYLLLDSDEHAIGVLATVAYKPDGLTEPGGELESTLSITHRLAGGIAAASITYGQDPDLAHHDGEIALSAIEPIARHAALGGVARARSGLGSATELGASWDGLAGAVARTQLGALTFTALGGTQIVGPLSGGTRLGALGTVAVGSWW